MGMCIDPGLTSKATPSPGLNSISNFCPLGDYSHGIEMADKCYNESNAVIIGIEIDFVLI